MCSSPRIHDAVMQYSCSVQQRPLVFQKCLRHLCTTSVYLFHFDFRQIVSTFHCDAIFGLPSEKISTKTDGRLGICLPAPVLSGVLCMLWVRGLKESTGEKDESFFLPFAELFLNRRKPIYYPFKVFCNPILEAWQPVLGCF
jgi:hypothetical protein